MTPQDEEAHQDGRLMHELAMVNSQIGRYVLRFLDADSGHAEAISTDVERALANRMTELAAGLQDRADRREALGSQPQITERDTQAEQQ
jgi:hypothetical protein